MLTMNQMHDSKMLLFYMVQILQWEMMWDKRDDGREAVLFVCLQNEYRLRKSETEPLRDGEIPREQLLP